MLRLGGTVFGFADPNSTSASKGEILKDTIKMVSGYADVVIMRSPKEGAAKAASLYSNVPVINAGDGVGEHPTQALLDMFTMYEKYGHIDGLKVAICGDLYHSRVVRSNVIGLTKLGATVNVAGPRTMVPVGLEKMGCTVCRTVDEAVTDADAVMGLRVQLERQTKSLFPSVAEYSKFYSISEERLKLAKSDAILLHPGPCNHGVELPTAVYDCPQSVINEQVTNGVAVRMAVLYLLIARRNQ